MFGSFGITELLIVLAVVVLLFGAKRIPEIGRALGQSIGNFRKGIRNDDTSADKLRSDVELASKPESERARARLEGQKQGTEQTKM
jgi:sec-independent protein translocase protein TatA